MEAVTFRSFQPDDADAVYRVALAAWRYTYRDIYDVTFIDQLVRRHYALEALRRLLPSPYASTMFFEVALASAEVVGFCHMGERDHGMELFRLYLLPAYIGKGVGRQLLERGEAFLVAQGVLHYCCFVQQNNALGQRFYLRQGFYHVPEFDQGDNRYMKKQLPRS